MAPVERLPPVASNPVLRIEPHSRERRRREPEEGFRGEHDETPREGFAESELPRRSFGEASEDLLDPNAPGRRIDIKA